MHTIPNPDDRAPDGPAAARLKHETGGDVVELAGDIDSAVELGIGAVIEQAVARSRDVTFDFAQVPFMDSAGLRLISRAIAATWGKGTVTLRNLQPLPRAALLVSGLAGQVRIEERWGD